MKHFLLSLCLVTIYSLHAIDNNVELVANKDFSDPALFANQAALAVEDPAAKWFAGNIAQFTTSIATGAFESSSTAGGTFYDYFLGQITSETLNTGRYHLSISAKGTTPFFLKLSGTNALGTEWSSVIKNAVGQVVASGIYSGYSIKFTPAADWSTIEADLDITVPTDAPARLYFIFPDEGSVSVDDVSFKRTGDIPVFTTYYVRPTGDDTSWTNLLGIDSEQIITSSSPAIVGTNTYYFAKGTYSKTTSTPTTTTAFVLTTGKIYGGFSGNETTIDLSARALSDKDGNGIIEPWEMTNETIITGTSPISGEIGTARLVTVTGGEVNGLTLQDHYYRASGAIILGVVSSLPNASQDIETNAGKMINCTVRKLKVDITTGSCGPVMMTNKLSLIDGCLIEECSANTNGKAGAVFLNLLGGKISNSVLRNNISKTYAGAIWANSLSSTDMNAVVENCVLYNNTSLASGGAIRGEAQANKRGIQIINCTLVNNKTTTANTASIDLISGGLVVNSIVVDDPLFEVRPNNNNNYISNNAIGALQLNTGITAYPNTNMATNKTAADFNFTSYSTYVGAMQPGAADFNQTTYDAIRASNFKITSASSAAVTTPGLKTLPSSYLIGGTGASVALTATIPTTDITGVTRNPAYNYDLGAYQLSGPLTPVINNQISKSIIFASENDIVVTNAEGASIAVYAVTGQLLKSVAADSERVNIAVEKGIYIVKVDKLISKVLVK